MKRECLPCRKVNATVCPHQAASQYEGDEPTYCVNADRGLDYWFCLHYGKKIIPGTEKLNAAGECQMCAVTSVWDGLGEAPSFLRPDGEL
jgi:hypothetical protein